MNEGTDDTGAVHEPDAPRLPRRRALLVAAGVVVFALLGGAMVAAGAVSGGSLRQAGGPRPGAAATATSPAPPTAALPTAATSSARPVPASATVPGRLRTCSVAGLAADPRLANFQAQVVNATTGEVLFDRGGATASRTASVLKVLTSAAALSVLGPDYRARTSVVAGSDPGSVVLVGGGDLTLSRTPPGEDSVYAGAAHLDDLARQTAAAWSAAHPGTPITSLVLDSSLFGGPGWQPGWARTELAAGYMPEITALQVDGDRENPYRGTSPRSEDPIGRAGQAFSDALGGGIRVSRGTAPAGAAQLAAVHSQPVSTLVKQALVASDNAIAEMLARLVAVESGAGNTFDDLERGILAGLDPYGIDTTGIVIADGSGLSVDNAVAPAYLTRLFVKIHQREASLGVIADGTPLTFAVYALGDVGDTAKQAIDTITTGFFRCGDNLSNN